ncbi:MAG: UDP-N-acetylmuramate:L-alanyl-gamma-D-glutamyl-meso-diaminopimelate ligase, partial [Burkholderiales bacterium]|nr:UDP-N-acetylmuramate:L-alanyl-gamma-D-glutamyl-meso-diaminopimelate ligase [Burkholderiales bacterium]
TFRILFEGRHEGDVKWDLIGEHNVLNALAAVASARHAGVPVMKALEALHRFQNVKRRLEVRGTVRGITVYDDFAHHPTAIAATLRALRSRVGGRIFAVLEPRSNSMRMGTHRESLARSLSEADQVLVLEPADIAWDLATVSAALNGRMQVFGSVDAIVATLAEELREDDRVLIMSNGDFGGVHDKLLERLRS